MRSEEITTPNTKNKKEQSLEKRALLPTALSNITVMIAILYLIGFSYDQGYVDSYGVSTEFFPRTTQEYLIRSFYVLSYLVNECISKFHLTLNPTIISAALAFIILFMVIALPYPKWIFKIENNTKKFTSSKTGKLVLIPFIGACITLSIPTIFVSTLLILITPSLAPFCIGKNLAQKEISDFKKCNINSHIDIERTCISVIENDKIITQGILVAKSQTHVAIYDGKSTKIYPMKEQTFETFVTSVKKS